MSAVQSGARTSPSIGRPSCILPTTTPPAARWPYLRARETLTDAVLRAHLLGQHTIGLYLLDGEDKVRYGVLDHDDKRSCRQARSERRMVWAACRMHGCGWRVRASIVPWKRAAAAGTCGSSPANQSRPARCAPCCALRWTMMNASA